MKKKLAVGFVVCAAAVGGLAPSAFGAHRYNVETGNGTCKPTSASATDNADDPAKERSENSEGGMDRAADRSPAIQGTGSSKACTE